MKFFSGGKSLSSLLLVLWCAQVGLCTAGGHVPLEEIFFDDEVAPPACSGATLLPAVPRDFERFNPGSPFSTIAGFAAAEIADPTDPPAVTGPFLSLDQTYYFTQISFTGPSFRSVPMGGGPPGSGNVICDTAYQIKQTRLTAQFWIPGPSSDCPIPDQITMGSTPLALISADGGLDFFEPKTLAELREGPVPLPEDGDPIGRDDRALLGRELAKKGILYVRYREGDFVTPLSSGSQSIHDQFLFGENPFALRTRDLVMSRNPSALTAQDLRLDFRYGLAQGYLLSKAFLQHYIVDKRGTIASPANEAAVRTWLRELEVVYSGGSKGGAAALTAAGADDHAVGLDASGFAGYDAGPDGALRRLLTDWCEVPGMVRMGIRDENKNGDFVDWVYQNRGTTPSYARSYIPSDDPDSLRYSKLLILDTVSTHDHNWPLLSADRFWDERDGLSDTGFPNGETVWPARHLRQPNLDHGLSHRPLVAQNPKRYTARTLLVYAALLNLKDSSNSLPGIELVELTTPPASNWTIRARVSGLPASHTTVREHLRVFVLLSDDRDTRRYDSNNQTGCNNVSLANVIRESESQNRASLVHDTKPEEDYFVPLGPGDYTVSYEDANGNSVDPNGLTTSYRRLTFPAFALPGTSTPLVVATVQLFVDQATDNPGSLELGDVAVFSDLAVANEMVYPAETESSCNQEGLGPQTVASICPRRGQIGTRIELFGTDFTPETDIIVEGEFGARRVLPRSRVQLISRGIIRFTLPQPKVEPSAEETRLWIKVRRDGNEVVAGLFRLLRGGSANEAE